MIGTWEILFTLFIVLLLFGGKRLPEFARSLGQGIREFKRASSEISDELDITPKAPTKPDLQESKAEAEELSTSQR